MANTYYEEIETLKEIINQLDGLKDASLNGVPVSVTHLIPELVEKGRIALREVEELHRGWLSNRERQGW